MVWVKQNIELIEDVEPCPPCQPCEPPCEGTCFSEEEVLNIFDIVLTIFLEDEFCPKKLEDFKLLLSLIIFSSEPSIFGFKIINHKNLYTFYNNLSIYSIMK